jgi:hypothetical protein
MNIYFWNADNYAVHLPLVGGFHAVLQPKAVLVLLHLHQDLHHLQSCQSMN